VTVGYAVKEWWSNMSKSKAIRTLILLVGALHCGCVSLATYEMSSPSPGLSTEELSDALTGKSVTLTLVNGSIYEGEITDVPPDEIGICLDGPDRILTVAREDIHAVYIPRPVHWAVAGAIAGAAIVASVTYPQIEHQYSHHGLIDLGPVFVTAGEAILGACLVATIVGNLTPARRYMFEPVPNSCETLRVEKKDVLSDTFDEITVREGGKTVTYDLRIVNLISDGDHVLLVRPTRKDPGR
jgi:hypothetical protein